jgi:hypothetical protein
MSYYVTISKARRAALTKNFGQIIFFLTASYIILVLKNDVKELFLAVSDILQSAYAL